MSNKITYECKKCGWQTSIITAWADLQPKRCMNRKCNQSFRADPSTLVIHKPVEKLPTPAETTDSKKAAKLKYESKRREQSEEPRKEGSSGEGSF